MKIVSPRAFARIAHLSLTPFASPSLGGAKKNKTDPWEGPTVSFVGFRALLRFVPHVHLLCIAHLRRIRASPSSGGAKKNKTDPRKGTRKKWTGAGMRKAVWRDAKPLWLLGLIVTLPTSGAYAPAPPREGPTVVFCEIQGTFGICTQSNGGRGRRGVVVFGRQFKAEFGILQTASKRRIVVAI